jgi:hypothetical protein
MKKCTVNFGDVVLIPFPWADKETGSKVRPAVVISRENLLAAGQIIVLGISSKETVRNHEYQIINWKEAGLKFPSKVWLSRPYGIYIKYAIKIGKVQPDDLLNIYRYFISLF